MEVVEHVKDRAKVHAKDSVSKEKDILLSYLQELLHIEANLWGSLVDEIEETEEKTVENANHLIYLLNRDIDEIEDDLKQKEIDEFINDVTQLKDEVSYLKKKISQKDKLRSLINSFTLKLTNKKTYPQLEELYFLEKQLNEVVEIQEQELLELIVDISSLKNENFDEVEAFIEVVRRTRDILAGHLQHHELWIDEKKSFSNTSNILHALIVRVREIN